MNQEIKKITEEYLNSLSTLSVEEKEKIANFNANSEWIIFSGKSLNQSEVTSPYGLSEHKHENYRGVVRADQNGYLLEDLGKFPESFHASIKNKRRKSEGQLIAGHSGAMGGVLHEHFNEDDNGYYKLKGTEGSNWRLDENGYVQFRDGSDWFYKTYIICNKFSQNVFGGSDELITLLEEVWKEVLKTKGINVEQVLADDGYHYDLFGASFNTNQVPLTRVNSGYLHAVYYPVFPSEEKNKWWVAVKKEMFANEISSNSGIFPFQFLDKYKIFRDLFDDLQKIPTYTPTLEPTLPTEEEIDEQIGLIVAKIIEVMEENDKIVQRGRELGLHLKEISENEGTQFQYELDLDFPWNSPENNEARQIFKSIRDTYEENQQKLDQEEKRREEQENSLEQIKVRTINFIIEYLAKDPKVDASELSENNRNWEQRINNSSSHEEINDLKEKLIVDIRNKKKRGETNNHFINLMESAIETQDLEQLKVKLQKIEEYRGDKIYKDQIDQINALWEKLSREEPNNYRNNIRQIIEENLANSNIDKSDLNTENQEKINKLENQTDYSLSEINQTYNDIINNIQEQKAIKKLDEYINEYQKITDEGAKKLVRRKLLNFINKDNSFFQTAYQKRENEVNNLLGITTEQEQPKTPKEEKFPLLPILAISSLVGVVIVGALIAIRSRRSR